MTETSYKTGRPSSYTKQIGDEICSRLAAGESLLHICESEHMPARSTILLWVVNGEHKEFSDNYRAGRQANGEAHGDRIAQLGQQVIDGALDPQAAKVAIDALKWSAERMAPRQYGAKQIHTGPDGEGPVQIHIEGDDKALL